MKRNNIASSITIFFGLFCPTLPSTLWVLNQKDLMTTPILLLQRRSMLAWSILRRTTTTTMTTSNSIIVLFIGTCVIPIIYTKSEFFLGGFFGEDRSHWYLYSSHPKKWISHQIFCQPWLQVVSCYPIFTHGGGDTRCCVVIVVP
jgi:hypothetical protein